MIHVTLAQSVEHLTFNQVVGGSIPPCHTESPEHPGFFCFYLAEECPCRIVVPAAKCVHVQARLPHDSLTA